MERTTEKRAREEGRRALREMVTEALTIQKTTNQIEKRARGFLVREAPSPLVSIELDRGIITPQSKNRRKPNSRTLNKNHVTDQI